MDDIKEKNVDATLDEFKDRFSKKIIYSNCGMILLSINPFEDLNIYDKNVMKAYYKNYGTVEPHIYSIAENSIQHLDLNGNQTIIVSGESGSGKTENSKHLLKYIVWRCNGAPELERMLLASHFILECFGNAKTKINENSSRFGKYLTLYFDNEKLIGGKIIEHLFEKSRLTHQTNDNKNFHIFYMICAADGLVLKNDYFNSDDVTEKDLVKYRELESFLESLIDLKVLKKKLTDILMLGSLNFIAKENSIEMQNEEILQIVCKTFELEFKSVKNSFLKNSFTIRNELIERHNTIEKAIGVRDTMARHLYYKLFTFVIESINKILGSKSDKTISLLDIYGFEVFEENDFDQFCINWANERIQNEFIRRMFIERQDFYKQENVEWPEIEYFSNQSIITLLERKLGIVDLIDEESMNPCGSIESLYVKLNKFNKDDKHYLQSTKPNTIKIEHYAYPVEYCINNFIEKNTEISRSLQFFKIFNEKDNKKNESIIKYFMNAMNKLFNEINQTEIQYIRCIRPNKQKLPWTFDESHIKKQIMACGIIETIKLSSLTYPHIINKNTFNQRYESLKLNEKKYLEGINHIFIKTEHFKKLEELRNEAINNYNKVIHLFLKKIICERKNKLCLEKDKIGNLALEMKPFKDNLTQNEVDCFDIGFIEEETNVDFGCDTKAEILEKLEALEINNDDCMIEEIKIIKNKIQEAQFFYKKPCDNCKILETKYDYSVEALRGKKDLEIKMKDLKEINRKLGIEITTQKELIKDITILANHSRIENLKSERSYSNLKINFSNPHEVFGCLLDIYIENYPFFSDTVYPKEEITSLAHIVYKIIVELTERSQSNRLFYLEAFLFEFQDKICKFEGKVEQIIFFLSNLIELQSLFNEEVNNELKTLTVSIFEHACELFKENISKYLPDSLIYYQGLDSFRCEDSFFNKYINKTPSTLKLINQIDYIFSLLNFYYIPITFIRESLRYLLGSINVLCFNRILVQQNFLSFNRCTQINYNLNEISKFCQEIGFLEGIDCLKGLKDVVLLIFLIKNNQSYETLKEECSSLNIAQLNCLITKIQNEKIDLRLEKPEENISIFLEEPNLIYPDFFEKSDPIFCIPRYLPTKLFTKLLSSI